MGNGLGDDRWKSTRSTSKAQWNREMFDNIRDSFERVQMNDVADVCDNINPGDEADVDLSMDDEL